MDTDKLKMYAAPLIALVLILAWFFVIKPMLNDGALDDPATEPGETGEAEGAKPAE